MEWVETTGRTLEEAKDAALDQLGVDEHDAEFEVVEEAKSGLFGRLRQEARVRARVQPTTPRAKVDRRDRKKRPPRSETATADMVPAPTPAPRRVTKRTGAALAAPPRSQEADVDREPQNGEDGEVPTLDEQAEIAREFVAGVVSSFGATATTEVVVVEEDTLEVRVVGDDLGLLIGPKGATLNAVQELARTRLQRATEGGRGARLRVDIGGYRERRREALERFTRQVAEQVLASGEAKGLEPMSAPDRKVVHDTVNTIDGVRSVSDGEDPRRRVLLVPDSPADD